MTPAEKIPVWLIVLLLLVTAVLVAYAVFDGRRVDFWPPSIHEKTNPNIPQDNTKIEKLKAKIKEKNSYLSPTDVVALFPSEVQKGTIILTKKENSLKFKENKKTIKSIELLNKSLITKNDQLKNKISDMKKVEGTFLYKLLRFNFDTQCYGSSLNFTAGKNRLECKTKEELASRFLGFLEEVDFYKNDLVNNTKTAKKELIKLQNKHQFSTRGWYGPDVFRAIISEFYRRPNQSNREGLASLAPHLGR